MKRTVATRSSQQGFSLMESLVSVSIVSVVALGVMVGSMTAMKVSKATEAHHAASSLAASKMEELASLDILDLDSSADESGVSVTWPGLSLPFSRTTTVTVNGDGSRTVAVTVTSGYTEYPVSVTFDTNFASWE